MAQQRKTDWTLFLTIVLMVSLGLVMVFSSSAVMAKLRFGDGTRFAFRQLGWVVAGFIALMYFKRRDYRTLRGPAWAFSALGLSLVLLAAVYILDARTHRWLYIGGMGLQPSEFAKPALILFLAYFVTRRMHRINDRYTLSQAGLACAVLAASVVVADLGTAMVLMATAAAVFYVAGLERRYLLAAAGVCLLAVALAIVLKPYRLGRILVYLDKDYRYIGLVDRGGRMKQYAEKSVASRDPGYQATQSKIAVGSGGPLGVGLMQSKQKMMFLPEAHNDFIYAVVGEELGLWGSILVLFGYLVILWRGLRLFWIAPDDHGRYLALGVTVSITVQALFNMSVVLGIAPTKGIPLPMISYGGSSLLSTLICLGILLSVSEHQLSEQHMAEA